MKRRERGSEVRGVECVNEITAAQKWPQKKRRDHMYAVRATHVGLFFYRTPFRDTGGRQGFFSQLRQAHVNNEMVEGS